MLMRLIFLTTVLFNLAYAAAPKIDTNNPDIEEIERLFKSPASI